MGTLWLLGVGEKLYRLFIYTLQVVGSLASKNNLFAKDYIPQFIDCQRGNALGDRCGQGFFTRQVANLVLCLR